MSSTADRLPLVPSDLPRADPLRPLFRAAHAIAANAAAYPTSSRSAEQIITARFPRDTSALAITRAASAPASTTGWGSGLAITVVDDFVASLQGQSGAARLIAAGTRASLDGVGQISIPRRTGLPSGGVPWIGEGAPHPIKSYALDGVTLGPAKKLAIGAAITRELVEHSSGEAVIRTLLQEDGAVSLDTSLFDDTAASSPRPAGLLAGVTPITATAGGGEGAMIADLENLSAAITGNGGVEPLYFAHPTQSGSARLRLGADRAVDITPTLGIPEGTVIAVEPRAFASGFDAVPRIEASKEAAVHFEDTTPAAIGTAGTPNVVAAPVRSAWQSDLIVIRMILRGAWAMRAAGMVAVVEDATWGAA